MSPEESLVCAGLLIAGYAGQYAANNLPQETIALYARRFHPYSVATAEEVITRIHDEHKTLPSIAEVKTKLEFVRRNGIIGTLSNRFSTTPVHIDSDTILPIGHGHE